jgi:hypothetical protein
VAEVERGVRALADPTDAGQDSVEKPVGTIQALKAIVHDAIQPNSVH